MSRCGRNRNGLALALAFGMALGLLAGFLLPATRHSHIANATFTPLNTTVVHVALLVGGPGASASAMVTLKSILLHRRCQLQLHLVVDTRARLALQAAFEPWAAALPQLSWTYYSLDVLPPRVAWLPTRHRAGAVGTSKLLYDHVLPHVQRVVALDTDLILHRDIAELWRCFDAFEAEQLFAAAEQQSDWYLPSNTYGHRLNLVWPARGRGLNSGVLLLALDRMRAWQWESRWPQLAQAQLQLQPQTGLADQDIWNLVCVHEPALCGLPLPCQWNLQLHDTATWAQCHEAHRPGILHWNSPAKRATTHPDLEVYARFWSAVQALAPQMLLLQAPWAPSSGEGDPGLADALLRVRLGGPALEPLPEALALLDGACQTHLARTLQRLRHHPFYAVLPLGPRPFHCSIDQDPGPPLVVQANSEAQAERMVKEKFYRLLAQKSALRAVVCQPAPAAAQPPGGNPSDFPILVTHMSLDRCTSLMRMAENWQGAIHAVLYVVDAQLPVVDHVVETLLAGSGGAPVAYELVVHLAFQDEPSRPYPVNQLRNLGLALADSSSDGSRHHSLPSAKVMLDADLVPVPGSEMAVGEAIRSAAGARVAYILPALESSSYGGQAQHPKTVAEAQRAFHAGELVPFRLREWPLGHNATAFGIWASSASHSSTHRGHTAQDPFSYPVDWEPGFEPYLAVAPSADGDAPQYPSALEGFGWNKVVYTSQLHRQGYSFRVLRQAAAVHYPHAPSLDLERYRRRGHGGADNDCNARIARALDPSLATLLSPGSKPALPKLNLPAELPGHVGAPAGDRLRPAAKESWDRAQQAAVQRARGLAP